MIGVLFDDVEQFLQELDNAATPGTDQLQRGVVRAAPIEHNTIGAGKHVIVLASFIRLAGLATCDRDELVRLHAHCGHLGLTDDDYADQKTRDRRDSILAAITATCERHGLDLCAGAYELTR